MTLIEELKQEIVETEVCTDEKVLIENSRDASIFQIIPACIVYPKSVEDIKKVIKIIERRKKDGENVAITGRSAGTDMTGGSLTEGVILSFVQHMNKVLELDESHVVAQPDYTGSAGRSMHTEIFMSVSSAWTNGCSGAS